MRHRRASFFSLRPLKAEQGFILIEALLLVFLILLTTVTFAQLIPSEFSFQRSMEDRAQARDIQDKVFSWAAAEVAPAKLPLDYSGINRILYHTASDCYDVSLNTDTHQLTADWGAVVTDGSGDPAPGWTHCPSSLGNQIIVASDISNSATEPFLNYFSSSDASSPISDPTAPSNSSCVHPAPTTAPTAAPNADGRTNISGTFVYTVVYVYGASSGTSEIGQVSPSLISNPITVSSGSVNLSNIPVSSDFGVEGRMILRKQTDGDGKWYQLATIPDNMTTTYNDTNSQADVVANNQSYDGSNPQVANVLNAGRCVTSFTLHTSVDIPNDSLLSISRDFRLLMSSATTSASLANNAVISSKIGAPCTQPNGSDCLDGSRIQDGSLGPKQLSTGLTTSLGSLPLVSDWRQNYAPTAAGVGKWITNASSPAYSGALALKAGDDSAGMVADWSSLCKSGYVLEARGVYTVLNADPSTTAHIGLRLIGHPSLAGQSNSALGDIAQFSTGPVTVAPQAYQQLASSWELVDFGSCRQSNALLDPKANPFLYKIQAQSDSQAPFAVVNAQIELRWEGENQPLTEQPPFAPELLSPLDEGSASISPAAVTTFSARFLDPNVLDNGRIEFQLCRDSACTQVVNSYRSYQLANFGLGSWSTVLSSLAAGDYYWRARGVDGDGQTGSWSDPFLLHLS